MGGLPCIVPRNAILRFDGVPTRPRDYPEFDRQLRECCKQTDIIHGIVEQGEAKAKRVCDLLAKDDWTLAERTELYDIIDGLEY